MRYGFMNNMTTCYFLPLFLGLGSCKSRSPESSRNGNPAATTNSFGGFGDHQGQALLFDWYQRDTKGERSGAPRAGGVVISSATPGMKDNAEFGAADSAISGSARMGRPEDSGVPLPVDPLGRVCTPAAGEVFEKVQPLFCVPVPQPSKTDIVDKPAAIRLGKALFWDTQVGGDGKTACASCHFSGGADSRVANTVHPGSGGVFDAPGVNGPGQIFSPFQNLDSLDDRVGSAGVVGGKFVGVDTTNLSNPVDDCAPDQIFPFFAHRRVTGRNTPSVIAAIFNEFNFWDGRANPVFNGYDPFGVSGNASVKQALSANSSLASLSVGPANNSTEMSCDGRPFNGANSLAQKLLARRPLQFQEVSRADSVLGLMSAFPAKGLNCYGEACTYRKMVLDAFGSVWDPIMLEHFSRLWGQALQAYMATLVPDQTRFDQYLAGKKQLFNPELIKGMDVFLGHGACNDCHVGAEMTDASVNYATRGRRENQGQDEGFHNLGVTATREDLGRASIGPGDVTFAQSSSKYNQGAFKTPSLRNLKLTAPYFHNGGKASIEDVVDFYAHRGGDVPNAEMSEELHDVELDSEADQANLVAFLRDGLLDCRVEKYRAPFDHPSLEVPNGATLSAIGMTGTGSCRLSPNVAPTTVNCIKNPGVCDSASGLHVTSIYKDLTGRVPTSAEVYSHAHGGSTFISAASIRTLMGSQYNLTYELRILVEKLLGRKLDQGLLVNRYPNYYVMAQRITSLPEFKGRAGGSVTGVIKLMYQQLVGRQPNPVELKAASTTLTARNPLGPVNYVTNAAKGARIIDIYYRFLRRAPNTDELSAMLRLNNDVETAVTLMMSKEYKTLANTRDDI